MCEAEELNRMVRMVSDHSLDLISRLETCAPYVRNDIRNAQPGQRRPPRAVHPSCVRALGAGAPKGRRGGLTFLGRNSISFMEFRYQNQQIIKQRTCLLLSVMQMVTHEHPHWLP